MLTTHISIWSVFPTNPRNARGLWCKPLMHGTRVIHSQRFTSQAIITPTQWSQKVQKEVLQLSRKGMAASGENTGHFVAHWQPGLYPPKKKRKEAGRNFPACSVWYNHQHKSNSLPPLFHIKMARHKDEPLCLPQSPLYNRHIRTEGGKHTNFKLPPEFCCRRNEN